MSVGSPRRPPWLSSMGWWPAPSLRRGRAGGRFPLSGPVLARPAADAGKATPTLPEARSRFLRGDLNETRDAPSFARTATDSVRNQLTCPNTQTGPLSRVLAAL